jgi:hypothetical protein
MALILAVFALVIIGGLVASNFMGGVLEQQSGRSVLQAVQAQQAAEGELWAVLPQVEAARLLSLPLRGPPLELDHPSPEPGLVVQSRVARLADNLFLVLSRAVRQDAAGGPLAIRSVGLLTTLAEDGSSGAKTLRPISQRAWLQLY